MTVIRLRDSTDGDTHLLGSIPLESIDRVIPTLKHWGLQNMDGRFVDPDNLSGSFVLTEDGGAYFQVDYE